MLKYTFNDDKVIEKNNTPLHVNFSSSFKNVVYISLDIAQALISHKNKADVQEHENLAV